MSIDRLWERCTMCGGYAIDCERVLTRHENSESRIYVVELDGAYIGTLEYEPEVGNHGLSVNEANRIEHAYIFRDKDLASVIASLWGGLVIEVASQETRDLLFPKDGVSKEEVFDEPYTAEIWAEYFLTERKLAAFTDTDLQAWLVRAFKAGRAFEIAHPTPAPRERS